MAPRRIWSAWRARRAPEPHWHPLLLEFGFGRIMGVLTGSIVPIIQLEVIFN
jgi:hypothetical protein